MTLIQRNAQQLRQIAIENEKKEQHLDLLIRQQVTTQ